MAAKTIERKLIASCMPSLKPERRNSGIKQMHFAASLSLMQ
jgi:hypothetical protein